MTNRETIKNILFDLGVEGNEYGDLIDYISNLKAEIKRLREGIADVADDMVENLPNNLRVYVSKLRKVIE